MIILQVILSLVDGEITSVFGQYYIFMYVCCCIQSMCSLGFICGNGNAQSVKTPVSSNLFDDGIVFSKAFLLIYISCSSDCEFLRA